MKSLPLVAVLVAAGFLAVTVAYGASQAGNTVTSNDTTIQAKGSGVEQFQKETASARQELAAANLELRKELASDKPDEAAIAKLQDRIVALRTQIRNDASSNGLAAQSYGPEGKGYGYPPFMMARGYGYGPSDCAGW